MIIKNLIFFIVLNAASSSVLCADYDVADLEKLFTDKKQRSLIDAERSGRNTSAAEQTKVIKVSGYMTRSDGKNVVWVNDKNTLDSTRIGNVEVRQSSIGRDNKVTVSVDGKLKKLKPGEVWHKDTGSIVDNQK